MDNVTHTLFALTLARTPISRAGRGTTAALVLASNAPDIDIVAALGGGTEYLRWHRGPTHGPLGVIGLAVVVTGMVWLVLRWLGRRPAVGPPGGGPDENENASFRTLVPIALLGVLCHVLMDVPTSYGTRLLSPFDWHWFSTDLLPIVDVYLLAALFAGLMFGAGSEVNRRRNVTIVFTLMALNYGVRAVTHERALAGAPRLFGPLLPQPCDAGAEGTSTLLDYWPRATVMNPRDPTRRCLVRLVALPTFLSPLQWRVIAHLSNAYEIQNVNLLERRFWMPPEGAEVLWRTTVRAPNVWTPAVLTAAATPLGQTFLGFARLPAVVSVVDASSGVTSVRWTDLRFTDRPLRGPAPNGPFSIIVRIDSDGRVLEEHLGP